MAKETRKNTEPEERLTARRFVVKRSGKSKSTQKEKERGHRRLALKRPGAGVYIRESEVARDKYSTHKVS